jgi:predicted Fe-Mo cluster-binding NifX family protein
MKQRIAVTSQNRKTITGHAGKCRKFWVYAVEGQAVWDKHLLELAIEQTFHESGHAAPHPLDGVNVLICGGMGQGLQSRLKQKGILAVATAETDPDRAVAAWLAGSLVELAPDAEHGHDHDHGQGHGHGHGTTVPIATLSANVHFSQPLKD